MSLFGSLMGDIEEDPFFGSHMNMMRQMNTMMNSFFSDPFSMGFGDFDRGHRMSNSLMPFSMPIMPNFNRLLSGSLDSLGAHSYSSSTVVSMSSGPDGRPQVYKATSSTRTAPGGIKETQKTVTDTRSGTKKMAIGHHIGERAHIIEKEQNMHTGDREERQDFINLDEEEAEDFNKEWETKTRSRSEIPRICSGSVRNRHGYGAPGGMLAITGGPSSRTPYSPPGQVQNVRKSKNVKTVSGSPPPPPPADL
ncbi:myeloid leukemia factor isoform X3 [Tribolium castaneum]|uniref:Myeloid leukemia factor-like Protein n=1 Tax=Tribolium castaneum TaxID=7070 RepID=A0A139WE30_TRICA|nr:PREDICTED: myeloid leukemia factor isoform X4 [Tribolium castaneum]KYB26117.1 Myeloid leukemia factor-like Protein [Tribolium castaneum]|eukprot:XP_008196192.1 PREDICTED: myeloid leukemia factor isoform X4 [Tribolium castaneum]